MFWLLLILVWSYSKPYPLKPVVALSEQGCAEAGKKFMLEVAVDKPDIVDAMTWQCVRASNPFTEKQT